MWLVPTCFQANFRHMDQVLTLRKEIACFGYVLHNPGEIAIKNAKCFKCVISYLQDIKIWL